MGAHSLVVELDYADWFSIALALRGVRLPVAKYQMGPPVRSRSNKIRQSLECKHVASILTPTTTCLSYKRYKSNAKNVILTLTSFRMLKSVIHVLICLINLLQDVTLTKQS